MLGVVTGLKSEAKLLNGLGLACVSTGGQAREARRKIDRLIGEGATGLISFGIAGALSPDLKAGDLIVADTVANDIGEVWQTHQPWLEALLPAIEPVRNGRRPDEVPHHAAARRGEGHANAGALWTGDRGEWDGDNAPRTYPSNRHPGRAQREPGPIVTPNRTGGRMGPGSAAYAPVRDDGRGSVKVGAILGLDRLLSSPTEKADAFTRQGALAIDMESHHVARAAGERNLSFIAVRAISDQATETLPAIMATFVDAEGQTKLGAVLAALIFGRVRLGELLRMGRASRRAHRSLLRCRGALAGLG